MLNDNRRKLPAIGTTKVVDGVTYTATPYVMDDKVLENHVLWDGGARGGSIREGAAISTRGQNGFTHEWVDVKLSRFTWGNQGRDTFAPIARMAIQSQRLAYEKAKALVDAYEVAA